MLGIEFMTPQYRATVFLFVWLSFYLGQWSAFIATELLAHWVWIEALNLIAAILPCMAVILFRTDESPQWILAAKCHDVARLKAIFIKLNRVNDAKLDDQSISSIISVSINK